MLGYFSSLGLIVFLQGLMWSGRGRDQKSQLWNIPQFVGKSKKKNPLYILIFCIISIKGKKYILQNLMMAPPRRRTMLIFFLGNIDDQKPYLE